MRLALALRALTAATTLLAREDTRGLTSDLIDGFVDKAERLFRSIRNPSRKVAALYERFEDVTNSLFEFLEDPDTELNERDAAQLVSEARALQASLVLAAQVAKSAEWLPSDDVLDELAAEADQLVGRMVRVSYPTRELRDQIIEAFRELKLWRQLKSTAWRGDAEARDAYEEAEGRLEELRDEVQNTSRRISTLY